MLSNLSPPHIRGITGLELAAGIFTKCHNRLATQLEISLTSGKKERPRLPLRIGINGDIYGGVRAPLEVGTRRVDVAYVNPAALVAMAYRGKGYYRKKLPLRVLGCFPSWDRIAIVVDKKLGVNSLSDIARRKIPLRVSTRFSAVNNGTYFTISTILSLYGFSFAHLKRWGGSVDECSSPTSPQRAKAIANRTVTAVFDEGVNTPGGWLDQALDNGYKIVALEPAIVKKLEAMGYTRSVLPKNRYHHLHDDVLTIDYSGWSLVTHRWLPDEVAYAAIETIDQRQKIIPVDDNQPLDMRDLCRSTEKCPLQVPLHPGALKYYQEKGYL